jgi:hypothetical protein
VAGNDGLLVAAPSEPRGDFPKLSSKRKPLIREIAAAGKGVRPFTTPDLDALPIM